MTFKSLVRSAVVSALLLALPAFASRAEAQISVIVSKEQAKTLTEAQIAEIFAGASTTWPDGTKQRFTDLEPDRYHVIEQGEAKAQAYPMVRK